MHAHILFALDAQVLLPLQWMRGRLVWSCWHPWMDARSPWRPWVDAGSPTNPRKRCYMLLLKSCRSAKPFRQVPVDKLITLPHIRTHAAYQTQQLSTQFRRRASADTRLAQDDAQKQ